MIIFWKKTDSGSILNQFAKKKEKEWKEVREREAGRKEKWKEEKNHTSYIKLYSKIEGKVIDLNIKLNKKFLSET